VSIGAQTAMAVGRALLVTAVALAVSGGLSQWLAVQTGRARTLAWVLLAAPFFTPSLLISYAFSKFALALVVSPWSHEALYIGMLSLKLIPVAVILRLHLPSALTPQAWFIYRLDSHASRWEQIKFRIAGAGEGPWVAGGLVFLLAFADFELASLWSIHSWTVAIFDAQVGGLALSETLRLAAWPLIIAFSVIAWVMSRGRKLPLAPVTATRSELRWPWPFLAGSATCVTLVPLLIVFAQALFGVRSLVEHFVLGREIVVSLLMALGATALADFSLRYIRMRRSTALIAATPGLLGALTVSLLLLALFQVPGLRAAYDTPLPLLLALAILLIPLGLLLNALRPQHTPALFIARQSGSRQLHWELEIRPHMIGCALLFCWAYFDFTASSILAPIGLTPVFVRLHNLAHYGQTAVLSAMMLAAFAAPVIVLLLTAAALHLYARRDGR
jgi:hypothetical protein